MKGIVVILLVSFSVCAQGAVLGAPECGQGPSYWCSRIQHARQCGAVQHCMTTVWKYQTITTESTETCTICELLVNGLKSQLQDKTSEEEIADVLATACDVLATSDWKDECKGIVKENLPQLIQMLANDIGKTPSAFGAVWTWHQNTDVICATLGLCAGLEDTVYHPTVVEVEVNTTCGDCIKFMTDIQLSVTSNETEAQVEQILDQFVCDSLASLSSTCKDLVHQYLPMALQIIADQFNPNITCRMFGFCAVRKTDSPLPMQLPHMKNIFQGRPKTALQYRSSEECDICKSFLSSIDDLIRDNTTQAQIKSEIESVVCGSLGDLSDKCKQLVEEYAPLVFDLLINELDPQTFCETIGLCSVPSLHEAISVNGEVALSKVATKVNTFSIECEVCKDIMEELVFFLTRNQTVVAIEDVLLDICARLPDSTLQSECKLFVQEYSEMVIDLLQHELDPTVICTAIKLCTGRITKQMTSMRTSAECTLCVLVIQEVQNDVQNISTKQMMKELLLLCTYVPEQFQNECIKLVTDYTPTIMTLLHSKEDPRSICALLTVCPSNNTPRLPYMTKPIPELIQSEGPMDEKVGVTEKCKICNTVLMVLKELVSDKSTKAEIEKELDLVCDFMPASLKGACEGFIQTYADKIIMYMLNHTDPYTICKKIELCNSTRQPEANIGGLDLSAIMSPYNVLPLQPVKDSNPWPMDEKVGVTEKCKICNTVLMVLKELVSDKSTKAEIEKELDLVCDFMPASLKGACEGFIQTYADKIIMYMLNHTDPYTICKKIELCNSTRQPEANIGGLDLSAIMSPYNVLPLQPVKDSNPWPMDEKVGVTEKCKICNTVLMVLKELVSDKSTKAEIEKELDLVCDFMPASLKGACEGFIQTYADKIIMYMLNHTDPYTICKKIELCNSTRQPEANIGGLDLSAIMSPYNVLPLQPVKDSNPWPMVEKVAVSEKCKICNTVLMVLKELVSDKSTKAEIEKELDLVCDFMPASLKGACEGFIQTYADKIIMYMLNHTDPYTICKKIELCNSTRQPEANIGGLDLSAIMSPYNVLPLQPVKDSNPLKAPAKSAASGELCTLCTMAMSYLKSELKTNATKEEIKAALDDLCSQLPASMTSECTQLVDKYGDLIIEYLIQDYSPTQICSAIGLCAAGKWLPAPVHVHLFKDDQVKAPAKSAASGELCTLCTMAMSYLKSELKTNATKEEIKAALDDLCSQLPASMTSECTQLVDKYADLIIEYLIQDYSPTQICSAIGMCAAGKLLPAPVHVHLFKDDQVKAPAKSAASGEVCTLCTMAISYLKSELKTNATKEEIKAALDDLCSQLPASMTSECTQLVDKYADLIIEYLLQDYSPTQICSAIGLCATGKRLPVPVHVHLFKDDQAVVHHVQSGTECVVCQLAMHELKKLLLNKPETVEADLEKLCSLLPSAIDDECSTFVKTYGDMIIQLLVNDLAKPKQVCSMLGLCTAKQMSGMAAMVTILDNKMPAGKVGIGKMCTACELVVNFLKNLIDENTTIDEVEKAVDKFCQLLPGTVSSQCNDVVKQYVPAILELVKEGMDPAIICKKIGACNSTVTSQGTLRKMLRPMADRTENKDTLYFKHAQRPTHILGQNKCTYGPAYWCAQRENAQKCNTVEHCEKHGWLTDSKRVPVY